MSQCGSAEPGPAPGRPPAEARAGRPAGVTCTRRQQPGSRMQGTAATRAVAGPMPARLGQSPPFPPRKWKDNNCGEREWQHQLI